MKHIRLTTGFLILVVMLTISFVGCKEEPGRSTLRLTMQGLGEQDRSLVPKDTPLEVSRYAVTGTGPQGGTFEVQSSNPTIEVEGLLMGNWQINAVGQNSQGVNLVHGHAECSLTSEPKNVLIELKTLVGTGTMSVKFAWDSTKISNPRIELWVTDAEGIKTKVTPTTNNLINGSVFYNATYPSGSYLIQGRLYSGNSSVAGCAEVVRIVGGKITEGTINLDLDKYPEIPSSLTLINKAGTPINCAIEGITPTVEALVPITARVSVPSSELNSDLGVTWYLDGEEISNSLECTFTPSTGHHRLDLIAKGALLASSGSASISFKATVAGTAGVPVLVKTVSDNTDGLKISGNTKVAFLPDGKILLASKMNSTLQICRIVRDSLEVVRTYTPIDGFNSVDITDILVDKITGRVAIADNQGPGITLYQYDATTTTLNKLYSRDNRASGPPLYDKFFSSIGTLMLDPTTGILYNTVPDETILPKSNLFASKQSEFAINSYIYWLFESDPSSGIVISPFYNRAAWFSSTKSHLKIFRREAGELFSMQRTYSSSTGTPYLTGINAAEFIGDRTLITGGDTALNRFRYYDLIDETQEDGWIQETIWVSGDAEIGVMTGVVGLFTDATRDKLYVLCKESKNILVFQINKTLSVNSNEGMIETLAYVTTVSLGDFTPSKGVISPDKENMLIVSDLNNHVLLYRIPQ